MTITNPTKTHIDINDLEVQHGPTWRKCQIGDTFLTVWLVADRQKGTIEYKAATRRGDIVNHPRLPSEIHHLDRAFEHAVYDVIQEEGERVAARACAVAEQEVDADGTHVCTGCAPCYGDPDCEFAMCESCGQTNGSCKCDAIFDASRDQ